MPVRRRPFFFCSHTVTDGRICTSVVFADGAVPREGFLRCVGLHDVRRDELLNTTGATRECYSTARPHVRIYAIDNMSVFLSFITFAVWLTERTLVRYSV